MTVYHPRSLEGTPAGPPGGVTVGRTTYSVNDDGSVDCPKEVETEIAEALADAHDIDVGDIVESDSNAEPDEKPAVTPDHTRDDLESHTKEVLLEMARERDIGGRSSMTKDELIDALSEG